MVSPSTHCTPVPKERRTRSSYTCCLAVSRGNVFPAMSGMASTGGSVGRGSVFVCGSGNGLVSIIVCGSGKGSTLVMVAATGSIGNGSAAAYGSSTMVVVWVAVVGSGASSLVAAGRAEGVRSSSRVDFTAIRVVFFHVGANSNGFMDGVGEGKNRVSVRVSAQFDTGRRGTGEKSGSALSWNVSPGVGRSIRSCRVGRGNGGFFVVLSSQEEKTFRPVVVFGTLQWSASLCILLWFLATQVDAHDSIKYPIIN